jgi:ubiquinone biosynthesis protein
VAIDCGMCCRIDRYLREKIADMFIAFVARDFEKVANIYIDMSESTVPVNKKEFVNDIRKVFDSLPDNISEIDTTEIVKRSFSIMFRHKLMIPRELTQLIKSISMIEGMCRELDPEFQIMTVAENLSKELFAQRYSPDRIAGDVFSLLIKMIDILKNLPDVLSNIAEKIENGTIQHRFLVLFGRSERSFISRMVTRICSAFIITGSMIALDSFSENLRSIAVYLVFVTSVLVFISTFRKGSDNDDIR